MEKRKFNVMDVLGEQLAGVAELNTSGPEQIEYIDIGLLDGDERNFYQLTDIDELADNIQMCGLQQPIRVRAGEGGRFTIVSGHRRRAALAQLVEKGLDQFRRVPCIRETDDASPALQELRLIFANSSTRKLTSAEISEQSKRVEALFYQLKEEGYEFPEGRMRDAVAAACNTHGSQIARVRVIDARLVEELTAMWKRNELPEQSAYTLAKLPPNMQHRIFTAFPKIPTGSTLENLLRLYKDRGYRWEPCLTCPDGKECKRGDAFLRHDAECCGCDVCGGQTCCLECSKGTATYYPCDKACSKAKAKRKEAMDANKAAEKAAEDRQIRKLERETQASALRLVRAADAAGIQDKTTVVSTRYGGSYTVGHLRELAAGQFDGHCIYVNDLATDNLSNVAKAARALHCSADYIVGLTEELNPGQSSGVPLKFVDGSEQPTRSGPYYCRFLCDGMVFKQVAWWDNVLKRFSFRKSGDSIESACLGWFPLPEVDEKGADT